MFNLCYDLFLFLLGLTYLPKILWQLGVKGKYKTAFKQRLGFGLPFTKETTQRVVWFHMVSVGETRAMTSLYKSLKEKHPEILIYLSTTTETGQEEAKRSLPGAEGYFFLPLDFSWIVKRLVKRIKPNLLILSESDFWYNFMKAVKKEGGKIILFNGKISETSTNRFAKIPWFASKLFNQIDLFCLQNEEYQIRFRTLNVPMQKMRVTGNLKFATQLQKITDADKDHWRHKLGLQKEDIVVTIGSSHPGEEELLLNQLQTIPNLKILLVPRHPERFSQVAKWLEKRGEANVILVNQMGILSICYQLSDLAIVGGSFIPGVGGHNIFEPIQAGIPVFFGPHMEGQKELTKLILQKKGGIQTSYENLKDEVEKGLNNRQTLIANGQTILGTTQAVHEKNWQALEEFLALKL